MSRKWIVLCSCAVTAVLILYLGYEAASVNGIDTAAEYFETYLNHLQKMVFNGMIYALPMIYAAAIPFYSPEVLIRLQKKLLRTIALRSMAASLFSGAFVIVLSMLTAAGFAMTLNAWNWMPFLYLKLVLFDLQCSGLFYLIYIMGRNTNVAVFLTFAVNLAFSSAVLWMDFFNYSGMQVNTSRALLLWSLLSGAAAWLLTALFLGKRELSLYCSRGPD